MRWAATWAAPWTRAKATGTVFLMLACGLLLLAHAARVARVDPPYMYAETFPPLLWVLASVSFLAGMWRLLDDPRLSASRPTCANCGAIVKSDPCAGCGMELALR